MRRKVKRFIITVHYFFDFEHDTIHLEAILLQLEADSKQAGAYVRDVRKDITETKKN